jgi:hypothetical protein
MDTLITFAIVTLAVIWGVQRLRQTMAAKRTSSCGSCGGCGVAQRKGGCHDRGAVRPQTPSHLHRVAPAVLIAAALTFSPASFAQEVTAEDTVATADLAAEEEEPAPPKIVQGLEQLKEAFANASGGIEISGFFDMQAVERAVDPDVFSAGDFELDFARDLGKNAQLAAAVVTNDEGTNLAVGFVDIHFFGHMVAPRGRLPVEKGFHLQLGRFDVPFGQDWQFYAAKDRIELSAPLTTDTLLDGGFNDTGLRILGGTRAFNYSAFVIRGDGPGSLYGGRLGITPFDNPYRFEPHTHAFEAGVSLMQDLDGDRHTRSRFLALDASSQLGAWNLRGEYLRCDAPGSELRTGWHLTAAFDTSAFTRVPLTTYARYDAADELPGEIVELDTAAATMPRTERISAGVNATLFEFLMFKLEYQRILEAPFDVESEEGFRRNAWFAQAVIVF